MRREPRPRSSYKAFRRLSTRWEDIDMYGHVNNVRYYSYFDTAVNGLMMDAGVFDPHSDGMIGLVVETRCTYFESLGFPCDLEIGIAVVSIGRSSVRYEVAVFQAGSERAAAEGYFVHVYVDRDQRNSVDLDNAKRQFLTTLLVEQAAS